MKIATDGPPDDAPEEIAGVRLGERVRSGGPMAVYAGEDALGLRVRVYVVRGDALGEEFGDEGFLRAVRDAAEARHPALVPFTTGGRAGELVYAVAKETPGRSVDEILGRGGALAVERGVSIAATVADVLAALEAAGTRHGDLTPRRVMLPGRGQVAVRPPRVLPPSLEPRKARYQAPEEARGEPGDIRSDLYVLGLLLVEMLTGKSPVPGSGSSATASLAVGSVPPVKELVPAAATDLQTVLQRLLAFAPGDRYASAADAHAALAALERGAPLPTTAAPADAVPVAVPLDEERPETAPIAADAVRQAQRAAAAPSTPAPPRAAAPALRTRRGPGRLHVEARLGEALLEIGETVCVGWPEGGLDVLARPEPFDGAAVRIEPGDEADVLTALAAGVSVNGTEVERQELQPGDIVAGPRLRARYERAARGVLRATGRPASEQSAKGAGAARGVLAAAVLGTAVVLGFALVRFAGIGERSQTADTALREQREALAAAQDAAAREIGEAGRTGGAESAARTAYESARAAARRRPDEIERARAALRDVARRYPETAYGRLAEIEAAELGTQGGPRGDKELDTLVAEAETDAAEGRLDDALRRLRAFAEERLDTIEAVEARRAMVRLEAEMDARVAADTAKYRQAIDDHEYPLAIRIMNRMLDYVPIDERDVVLAAKRDVQRRMDAVLAGGGTTAGESEPPTPPGEGPNDEPPPVRPPDTPVTDDTPTAPDEPDPDEEAQASYWKARRAMDSGRDRVALAGFVEFLREHKDTPTGAKNDIDVRRRITALAAGPAGVEELFRGEVERRDRGRYRITYDFEDPEQWGDFRDVNAFEAPPRADWKQVAGTSRAKGSGAFVLDAHFEPEFLSMEVRVQPERAHDLGVIMFEAGEPRRYYLYTIQNSFFQLGKGAGREDFRENAIVLFGPGMWRDAPPDEIGFVRKCGSEEPRLPPGQPAKIKCGKSEGEVWMRFPGGRTIRGSAYGDEKYEFTGLTPGVFILNSAGIFDEIVVEGVPDPAWVEQRWRDILNEL